MSLFYKIRNVPTSVHVGCYAIIGGISTFTLGVAINDLYCFNILNENQYKPNNLYCRYYSAKYTKSFIGSFIMSTEKPSTVAKFALTIDQHKLPVDYYETYIQKVNEVSITDIKRVMNKYILKDHPLHDGYQYLSQTGLS